MFLCPSSFYACAWFWSLLPPLPVLVVQHGVGCYIFFVFMGQVRCDRFSLPQVPAAPYASSTSTYSTLAALLLRSLRQLDLSASAYLSMLMMPNWTACYKETIIFHWEKEMKVNLLNLAPVQLYSIPVFFYFQVDRGSGIFWCVFDQQFSRFSE